MQNGVLAWIFSWKRYWLKGDVVEKCLYCGVRVVIEVRLGSEVNDQEKQKGFSNVCRHRVKKCFFSSPFSILIFFFVQYDVRLVWWNLVITRTLFDMLCFEDDRRSSSLRDVLQCMGLIRWLRKNRMCVWALGRGRKGRFDRHLLYIYINIYIYI